ncbi:hypothetical protein V2J09_002423 [Rumex salicifolius]
MPDEIHSEIGRFFLDMPPIIDDDGRKLPKLDDNTAEYIQSGLKPRWSDLDVNQHVNNVKYIGWILESAPLALVESHELTGMILEYRRECAKDSILQSLAAISGAHVGGLQDSGHVECQHLLRLKEGAEVLRARTTWRPKNAKGFGKLSQLSIHETAISKASENERASYASQKCCQQYGDEVHCVVVKYIQT